LADDLALTRRKVAVAEIIWTVRYLSGMIDVKSAVKGCSQPNGSVARQIKFYRFYIVMVLLLGGGGMF
jgi:hypothetical protein